LLTILLKDSCFLILIISGEMKTQKIFWKKWSRNIKILCQKSDENRARELGLKELEIITLASIIEGEALYDVERPIISGVYHNRLQKRMKLQADPTIQYIIKDGPRRLLNKDLKIKSPYNTYLNKGLPPGPINNPGKESIIAALFPNENEYLYFVARGDGFHKFSKTEKEHLIAKKKFQKIRRQVRRRTKTNKANS